MIRLRVVLAALLSGLLVLLGPTAVPAAGVEDTQPITDGNARFQVLSPTLVRMEYADDGVFHDEPTLTVAQRTPVPTDVTLTVEDGHRVVMRPLPSDD